MRTSERSRRKKRRESNPSTFRRAVAIEAARLLYRREFKEYYQAKREAARRFGSKVLPTNREVHSELLLIADKTEGQSRTLCLGRMRRAALEMMELLADFHPKVIGSTWTGHIRKGSDIDLHLFSDELDRVLQTLERADISYDVKRVRSTKYQKVMEFVHLHVVHSGGFEVEMTVYPIEWLRVHPKCSITGKAMARASLPELRQRLAQEHVDEPRLLQPVNVTELQHLLSPVDIEQILPLLPELVACSGVQQNHYHHLDVFEHTIEVAIALEELVVDERVRTRLDAHLSLPGPGGWPRRALLNLAALCHDIGKPSTWSLHRTGRIRFLGHESVGAGMTRAISARLELPPATAVALERMVALHMEAVLIPSENPQSAARIWQLFRAARDLFPELLLLSMADVMSARGPAQPQARVLEQTTFVEELLLEYFDRGPLRFPRPPVTSLDLEQELGVTETRLKERLLDRLTEGYVDGEFGGREEGLMLASELLDRPFREW